MKKFLILILSTIFALTIIPSCKKDNDPASLSLYCPDGAPALSVARLISDDTIVDNLDINVVTASTINAYVTGDAPKADIAIMPVNAASKVLGNANSYQMLGVVTWGNLYLLKKQSGVNITVNNLNDLIGKKVGVINLANVPGLTFKAILSDNDVPFTTYSGTVDTESVNLVGLSDGTAVTPAADCDYFVVPEPAATTKINATAGKLSLAGDLQAMYGDGNGYPQAVLVAKKSVILDRKSDIDKLIASFNDNYAYLIDDATSSNDIVSAITSALPEGTAPTFTANNLNKTVISNCGISFKTASTAKTEVLAYLSKINAITNNSFGTPIDAFFFS